MIFLIRKIAATIATGAALAMTAGSAWAVPAFTIDSSAITGGASSLTTGDFFAGVSSALFTTTGNTNSGSGWLQLTSLNSAGNPQKFFGTPANTYGLIVTFDIADSYVGGGTGINTANSINTITKFDFKIWADVSHDSAFTLANASTATDASYTNAANDDILLGFGTVITGLDGFNALGGSYLNSIETLALCTGAGTATVGSTDAGSINATLAGFEATCANGTGKAFFVDPDPFYSLAFIEFNNTIQGVDRNGNLTSIQQATTGVDFNNVPEPGSLALFGVGLAGLSASARRRKVSK